ncbi:MAG: GxxExxY protein [Terriglobales bacterium]
MHPNQIRHEVIGAAMKVHTASGPGLLEKAYEHCLAYELHAAGLSVERVRYLSRKL